jgi:ArsR family transcriptional regulator, virulence genes transcriptional regulator
MKKNIFDFQSEVCKTFANPRRLAILDLLKTQELSAGDITRLLGKSKANISQHLAVMRLRGILKTRRDGTTIYYRMANEKLAQACSMMQEALLHMMEGDRERIAEVYSAKYPLPEVPVAAAVREARASRR